MNNQYKINWKLLKENPIEDFRIYTTSTFDCFLICNLVTWFVTFKMNVIWEVFSMRTLRPLIQKKLELDWKMILSDLFFTVQTR